jgi:hypothetical protein
MEFIIFPDGRVQKLPSRRRKTEREVATAPGTDGHQKATVSLSTSEAAESLDDQGRQAGE